MQPLSKFFVQFTIIHERYKMKKNLKYIALAIVFSLSMTGCVSDRKELTVSEKGKTYYASEKECPYYEINKDDTVKCTDKNGKYLKTLKPLKTQEISVIKHEMQMNKINTIQRRQRWNNRMGHVGFYYATDYAVDYVDAVDYADAVDYVDFGY